MALAVGVDVLFPEFDRASPGVVADSLTGIDEDTRSTLKRLPDNDRIFAEALGRARAVLGVATRTWEEAEAPEPPPAKAKFAKLGGDPLPRLFAVPGLTRNLEVLENAASGMGMLSYMPDPDGVVRRLPLVMRYGETIYPGLAVEMLRVATGGKTILIKSDEIGITSVVAGGITIPTDEHGRAWVAFVPRGRDRYVSAKDVLEGTVPPQRIARHLVLIGTSAVGLLDVKPTPIERAMPGVEIHAQLLETIFVRSPYGRPGDATIIEVFLLIGVCVLMAIVIPRVGAAWGLALVTIVVAGLFGTAWFLYDLQGVLLGVVIPAGAGFILYCDITYWNYLRKEAQQRQVRDAFSHYMSADLVNQLASSPDKLKLGGEVKDLTVMFCDLRNFTAISEKFAHDPQTLTGILNRYFTAMTDRITECSGTIDKYIGDAIIAFWNAPIDDPEHVRHACQAALEMLDGVGKLDAKLRADAAAAGRRHFPLKIGIGLNSGECLVGNMGSDHRLNYSVIGDACNLASRFEEQTKNYGVTIIIGENTRAAIEDFATLELDLIRVKGKKEVTRIFGLFGTAEMGSSAKFANLRERHQRMLSAYREREWQSAREHIAEIRRIDGNPERLYDLFSRQLDEFEIRPPLAGTRPTERPKNNVIKSLALGCPWD